MKRHVSMWFVVWIVLGLLATAACGGGDSTVTDDGGTDVEEIGDVEDVPDDATDVPDRVDGDVIDEGTEAETDVSPTCGDGIVDLGEDCDDANDVEGDGCDNDCTYSCTSSTECDDGNDCNGTESCTDHACVDGTPPADGTACTQPSGEPGVCRGGACVGADCGNGTVDTGEECDDGNTDDTDACLSTCQSASCGDGHVWEGTEACDDGNDLPDDGCESDCTFSCTTDAECSDGEACNGEETCGASHACVDGTPPAEGTACTLPDGRAGVCRGGVCAAPECGNGTVDAGEECDDGNTDNTDACLSTCRNASCGDGFVWAGHETCDGDSARACTSSCDTTGTETCDACNWSACVPPPETCNGLDEDCVEGPDNGFTCVMGATGSCTTTCSSTGSRTCSTACEWGTCVPPAEVCNGADDDCVGGADNGFDCVRASTQSCTTSCASTGNQTCSDTCAWGSCAPPAEICNGVDDDCVGGADNGFDCVRDATRSCTTTCSSTGTETCGSTCAWGACVPPAETCNGHDDDCDGICDDGFGCCAGTTVTCTTTCGSTGVGACTATCGLPSGTACTPPVETCNGLDDDCVGGADNGFDCVMGATRTCTVGACTGTQTCGTSCTWSACDLGTAPRNDTCGGAMMLTLGTPARGTTCAAHDDYTPPGTCVGSSSTPAPDVTYVFRLTTRSNVVLDTVGTAWDTVLYLYAAACSGTPIACNDDGGGSGTTSRISITLDPGTYYVVVDGYFTTNTGPFVLNSTATVSGDECLDAIPLTLAATGGRTTATGSTAAYTNSTGSCGGTGTPARDVWYTFTLARRELVFINTYGSAFDTQLGLLTSCGGLAPVCEDDDCSTQQDQIARNLAAGTYYVLMDGWNGASGNYTLNIEHLPVGSDGSPTVLPSGLATYTGNTMSMTPGRVTGSCGGDRAPEDTYYWTTCPADAGGAFSATTCGSGTSYDSLIYVRSGATGTDLACNDDASPACTPSDASRINATIPGGAGIFALYIDGFGTSAGNYTAAISRP
ncbi:MAG: DUF4215 domain-containing protein [Deltaproteobacteria bacterium]|nr:DUF4215 domain-containing protein [Deltaproteobacteria bacterium]